MVKKKMEDSGEFTLGNIIKLTRSSEKKFKLSQIWEGADLKHPNSVDILMFIIWVSSSRLKNSISCSERAEPNEYDSIKSW